MSINCFKVFKYQQNIIAFIINNQIFEIKYHIKIYVRNILVINKINILLILSKIKYYNKNY